jgi:hypothetical protein
MRSDGARQRSSLCHRLISERKVEGRARSIKKGGRKGIEVGGGGQQDGNSCRGRERKRGNGFFSVGARASEVKRAS